MDTATQSIPVVVDHIPLPSGPQPTDPIDAGHSGVHFPLVGPQGLLLPGAHHRSHSQISSFNFSVSGVSSAASDGHRSAPSHSAPALRTSIDSLTDTIRTAMEKRMARAYKSTPKLYIYAGSSATSSQQHIRATDVARRRRPGGANSTSGTMTSSRSSHIQFGQDRMVSTSYSESLNEMLQSPVKPENKRLSILEEEKSRPASAAFRDSIPVIAVASNRQALPTVLDESPHFLSMDFIQLGSQDLLYAVKPKTAKIVGKYVLGDVIGEGSYGKVKEGFSMYNLKRVAVKIMKQAKLKKIAGGEENVKREIKLLKRLRHPNVVEMMDVIYNEEKHKTYMVLEYCATTLDHLLRSAPGEKIPHSQAQRYMKQIGRGLEYVHSNFVIHRDLKPENLLVTVDETIKITDFGVAEELPRYRFVDEWSSSAGSAAFQPPEVALGKQKYSGIKADIWAVGVILYKMISGTYPFEGSSIGETFDKIATGEYVLPEEANNPILVSLLTGIMNKNPDERLSVEAILDHDWLKAELPRDPAEIPVIPYDDGTIQEDVPKINRIPGKDSDSPAAPSTSDANEDDPNALSYTSFRTAPNGHISNPLFAYDTTLIPYLETMFEELPHTYRRSSLAAAARQQQQAKKSMRERLLGTFSRPNTAVATDAESPSARSRDRLQVEPNPGQSHTRTASAASNRSRPMTPMFAKNEADRCKLQ